MKLAVIGNPPYQEEAESRPGEDGKKLRTKPLYNKFVEAIIDGLNPDYFTFIIPSRWMVGGLGLDNFRERMMHDRRMKKIVHFPGSFTVFPSVKIDGGVNYFLRDKGHEGKCEFIVDNTVSERFLDEYDIILQDNNAAGILEKVRSVSSNWVSELCSSNKPFGISTNFSDFIEKDIDGSTPCMCRGKEMKFVASDAYVDTHDIAGKWKVCVGAAYGESGNDSYKVLSMPFVLSPNEICTQTYIVVSTFDKQDEAKNFMTYTTTKFFRYMLLIRKNTQDINRDKLSFVPDVLDYTCPWTDAGLYNKYKLDEKEIAYIESKIKELK